VHRQSLSIFLVAPEDFEFGDDWEEEMTFLGSERITLVSENAVAATIPVNTNRLVIFPEPDIETEIRFAINAVASAVSPGKVPLLDPILLTISNLNSLSFWGTTGDFVGVQYFNQI
jgi:hypothetical protein